MQKFNVTWQKPNEFEPKAHPIINGNAFPLPYDSMIPYWAACGMMDKAVPELKRLYRSTMRKPAYSITYGFKADNRMFAYVAEIRHYPDAAIGTRLADYKCIKRHLDREKWRINHVKTGYVLPDGTTERYAETWDNVYADKPMMVRIVVR